jgi:hypothetical protein
MFRTTKRLDSAILWLGVAVLSTGTGCMEERAPINRVQPDYIDKTDFIPVQYGLLTKGGTPDTVTPQIIAREPVFYTQTTLIAKPTSTGYTGLTSYSENEKVRWELTEDTLVARRAYEYVQGAPGGASAIGQNVQTGDVIAAYKITSHFDIRRDYNSTTGEELNVVNENTTDRPWYQRRFARVDWSQNLITGYNSPIFEQDVGQVKMEPVPIFVNTPNDPNAPVFVYSQQADKRQLDYFDVVNKAILHPESVYFDPDYPEVPVCWFGEGETDCAPSEVTFRVAFSRVDPTRDYEPASLTEPLPNENGTVPNIPHLNMSRFGFFDSARIGFDQQQHATLDTKRMHYAARHNLWVHHHALVFGDDTVVGCNVDADCGKLASSACHIGNTAADGQHRGKCAPLAYHHLQDDISCTGDSDCRQYSDVGGVSRSATCDGATHTCGEHMVRCSTDGDCYGIDPQSTCDLAIASTRADNRGLCLMPFRQRQVRAIPYHESNNYPDYMQPVTETIVQEWNSAFVEAVTSARRHECEIQMKVDPTTTDLASNPCNSPSVTGLDPNLGADAKFIYIGCHSPVWGTAAGPGQHTADEVTNAHNNGWDLPSCGAQGTAARLGDLRYNMIGAITDHDAQGYWGLANIAADPETGEMVAGRGAVWQTITDYYASYLVQLVRLLNNDIDATTFSDGANLVSAMKQVGTGQMISDQVLDAPMREADAFTKVTAAKQALDKLRLPDAGWFSKSGIPLFSKTVGQPGALALAQQRLLQGRVLGDGTSRGAQRLAALKGTNLEGMLMNLDQARIAATSTPDDSAALPATLEAASPMRRQSPAFRKVMNKFKMRLQAYQCAMEAAFSDDMLLGLAQRLATGSPIMKSDPDDAPVAFGRDWNFQLPDGTTDYKLMQLYASQFIHHGVLAHELGHSVGQRHNFTASADAINYNDNYWKVRGKGHPKGLRPRYEYVNDSADGKYYSKEEIAGRVDEWAYSSVMDYKGLNEDAHGIGRYDYAFVKNGYVNMVEAFKTVADKDGAITYSSNVAGSGQSTPIDLRDWAKNQTTGKLHGMHYVQIPDIFGKNSDGTPNIGKSNRYEVFLRETSSTSIPGWGDPEFTNTTADGHVLVPYRFDSDERAGLVWQCQRYDAGADAYESLHYVSQHMLDYYFVNSYARLRTGFNIGSYINRLWGRYVDQLHQTAQLSAFDLIEYADFLSDVPGFDNYLTDPKEYGGFVNHAAMNLAADAFVALVTMPEMGAHAKEAQFDGSSFLTPSYRGNVTIAINDGRAFESDWRNDVGFWWYDELNRAGAYYDKVIALEALTDPELMLLQRDTPTDIRLFQLSFYTMYPGQVMRLFGGLMSEDVVDFAPIYSTKDKTITRTHLTNLSLPPGTGTGQSGRVFDSTHVALDPQVHFTIQLWSAILGMAEFPATFDQTYMDYSRMWVDGSTEAVNITDPDKNTVSFTDPFTHLTYRAVHVGTGANEAGAVVGPSSYVHPETGTVANEAGVAAKMLLHLRDIEALRQQALKTGDTATATSLQTQEQKYLDLVNVSRDLTKYLGQGYIATP